MRVLPPNLIPKELWRNGVLNLSGHLAEQYRWKLQDLNLLDSALAGTANKAIYGGAGIAETYEHFAHRFAASSSRIEFISLDPSESFSQVSDTVLTVFSEGEIALLDLPCGTGAMSCGFISTIVSLRELKVLPRLPLTIHIVGGDISPSAIEICGHLLEKVGPKAKSQGITLSWHLQVWDATRGDHTADLIDKWFSCSGGAAEFVVVVSNFSGALKSEDAFERFSPCFEHILSRLHNRKSTVLWIEPATKSARTGLMANVLDFFRRRIDWFRSELESEEQFFTADYVLQNPLKDERFRSSVLLKEFQHR